MMKIKRLIISTYLGGVINLAPDLFKNFDFQEEGLKEYDRGFLLGVKLCQKGDGSTFAMLEEDDDLEILKCPIILMGDKFDELDIIDQLADDTTGLLYHTSTCAEQEQRLVHKLFSTHIPGSEYAYVFGILAEGSKLTQKEIGYILDDFKEDKF